MLDWIIDVGTRVISKLPGGKKFVNRVFINLITNSAKARPYPFSLWSPETVKTKDRGYEVESAGYTSWPSLVDRKFTGRHLPPDPAFTARLEGKPDDVVKLFMRRPGKFTPCPKSSVLFTFFAQWFTDSFLRTDPIDRRKNTSNHEIDLCQIYGLKETTTDILRLRSNENGKKGRLKSRIGNDGNEYGAFLFNEDGSNKDEFENIPYIKNGILDDILESRGISLERKIRLYASGLERGNTTIGYAAISAVFRREHNRLCREFEKAYPTWGDDRVFQTARNVNITMLLKIIIEDYINHLSPRDFKLFVEVGVAEKQKWYRTNRIAIEFDILYRWHGLVPDTVRLMGKDLPPTQFMYNNALVEEHGVEEVIKAASHQKAGKVCLNNTPVFLKEAESALITYSRQFNLQPYNKYRERFGKTPFQSFEELTGDGALADELAGIYKDVNDVEFMVGLLAEKRSKKETLGDLMFTMVGVDAFSHALTNPLLSGNVFGEDTFSDIGLEEIENTSTFQDIVKRNCGTFDPNQVVASFTRVAPPDST